VQYYEKSGRSAIDVKLKEVQEVGRVVTPSGLNVRSQPSTVGNAPLTRLDQNNTFKILKQVKSPDADNPAWYQVELKNGQQGFVSAAAGLSELTDGSSIVTLGTNVIETKPPTTPIGSPPTSNKGVVKGSVALRSAAGTTASMVGDLSKNTNLTIVNKVSGETYEVREVPYDQWYQVKTSDGQTGYVAAYYVDGGGGDKYSSAINPQSNYYGGHLAEANRYKSLVTEAAKPYSKWLKPSILAAIGSRESNWGLAIRNSDGFGDYGHGRGVMQIDDRYHQDFIATQDWRNPAVNIKYATDNVLADYYHQLSEQSNLKGFDLLRGAIAAYNGGVGGVLDALNEGLDVDYYTTKKDYSWDVIQRAGWFQENGWD
jgi:Bacterial SH3 domain/Transglycosylase SLT domain